MDQPRVAVLCGGGGAPGMNALLRAIVRLGLNRHGAVVLGVKAGFAGLLRTARRLETGPATVAGLVDEIEFFAGSLGVARGSQDIVQLDHASVSGLAGRGGSMLGASRCAEFHEAEARRAVVRLLAELEVTGVVVCGGDGTLAGAARLADESPLRVIGIPAAVANDLAVTDVALGFDTAANTLAWAAGQFAESVPGSRRVTVLEVTGRTSGDLARLAALASGAEIVVTPERGPLTEAKLIGIVRRLERALRHGRQSATVLIAEGVPLELSVKGQVASPAVCLAHELQAYFRAHGSALADVEVRPCLLGHLQRGGVPSVADRALAARFAGAAWQALTANQERSGVLGIRGGSMVLQDFQAAIDPERAQEADQLYELQKDMVRW